MEETRCLACGKSTKNGIRICADCRTSPCKTCDHRMPNCYTECKQYQNFHKANELRKQAKIKDAQCEVNKKAIMEYVKKRERWKK